jgi:serine/threonine protein phosphatase PrpC
VKVECYGSTRIQEGRKLNEDAFLIGHGTIPFAALCDGAGNAEQSAKKVLRLFQQLFNKATLGMVLTPETWTGWVKVLDSSILGAAESTFIAVSVIGRQVIGAYVGDSRAYIIENTGGCKLITTIPSKFRLGSGKTESVPINLTLEPQDILLLLSDGVWTPLNYYLLAKAARSVAGKHFSEVPDAIIGSAARTGRPDDMTAVAVRILA